MNWWEALNDPNIGNATCDGLYCGGPITHSVLFPIAMTALSVGIIGLIIAIAKARQGGP